MYDWEWFAVPPPTLSVWQGKWPVRSCKSSSTPARMGLWGFHVRGPLLQRRFCTISPIRYHSLRIWKVSASMNRVNGGRLAACVDAQPPPPPVDIHLTHNFGPIFFDLIRYQHNDTLRHEGLMLKFCIISGWIADESRAIGHGVPVCTAGLCLGFWWLLCSSTVFIFQCDPLEIRVVSEMPLHVPHSFGVWGGEFGGIWTPVPLTPKTTENLGKQSPFFTPRAPSGIWPEMAGSTMHIPPPPMASSKRKHISVILHRTATVRHCCQSSCAPVHLLCSDLLHSSDL